MRSRSLKPGFFTNELLGTADLFYGVLFAGLWCMADREGRLEDRPLRMCAQLFPYRRNVTEKKVEKALHWLHDKDFIYRYQSGGKRFIQIREFLKHQNPHSKEAPSKIPALRSDEHQPSTVLAPSSQDASTMPAPERAVISRASSLTPDSLTPDSLTPVTRTPVQGTRERRVGNGEHPTHWERWQRVKASYPDGTYKQAEWLEAERNATDCVDQELTTWDGWDQAVERFVAQQRAMGHIGTQYILSPKKYFHRDARSWAEPFPAPAPVTKPKSNGHKPSKPTAQIEDEAIAQAIAEGKSDTVIAAEIDIALERVQRIRGGIDVGH